MTALERHARVLVVDAGDEYAGQRGSVEGTRVGLISGRTLVDVRLDGREQWDVEGFYDDQLDRDDETLAAAS